MIFSGVTREDLEAARDVASAALGNQLIFTRFDSYSATRHVISLQVKELDAPGARLHLHSYFLGHAWKPRRSSASPDRTVVDGYPLLHETTNLCASTERRRAQYPGGGIALAGCLHLAPLPDTARQQQGRKRLPDSSRVGLQSTNRTQRHPRFQREGAPGSTSARFETSAHRL